MKDLVLAGGGGHALSILEALPDCLRYAGYTALSHMPDMPGKWWGNDSVARKLAECGILVNIAFIYAGLPVMKRRRRILEIYEDAGVGFATIAAPTAIVTPNSHVSDGCTILNGAIVNRASLGRHAVINTGAIVEHDCSIGSNTFIGPGAVMGGNVKIGDDCFIGLGARIRNGVTICSGATVGMGAIVTSDIKRPGIYHGFPLRFHPISD